MPEVIVLGAGFGGRYFADAIGAPCLSRSNGYDLNHNLDGVLREIAASRPRYIANFASQSMVGESWVNPADWMQTNVVAQTKLIKALAGFDFIDRYMLFTTPEVYGSTDGWVKEHWNFAPSTPYAASRAAGDWVAKLWHDQYDFPVVFTRAANIYGEHQQLYRIIPKAILFGLTGRNVPLHGGGKSIRSFVHMDDVTTAITLLMERGESGQTYHVSEREFISIRDLLGLIEQELGLSGLAEIAGDRPGKDQAYLLDSQRIIEMGWKPKVSLKQGIRRVADWIRNDLKRLSTLPTDYKHTP